MLAASTRTSVYIVDDDLSVRRSFARVFRAAGLHAVAFESPEDFFQSDYETKNSCLVVDATMPGISGIDMLARLSVECATIPVIIVTAIDDPETRKNAIDAGAIGYFRKPVDTEALLDAIRWIVSSRERTKS